MLNGKSVIAVVPARSGSKGIRDKNLRKLNGVSLIGLAGNTLARLKWLDAKIISTDSKKYATEAKKHGLAAPFLRPASLSADSTGAVETMQHALLESEKFYKRTFDILLIVEPTSPLRIPADIETAVKELIRSGADSALTVSPLSTKAHPRKIFTIENGAVRYFQSEGQAVVARQQLSGNYYYRNGLCYAVTRACLMDKNALITDKTAAVIVDRPIANIDDPIDLEWAAFLMRRKK